MTISDYLIITAMVIAPILAVQVQKFIERKILLCILFQIL